MSYIDTASSYNGPNGSHGQTAPVAVDPDRITIAVILARMTEFFDFFVYALASALVFPYVFFSFADPLTATLYSFAVFSLAFIARPIGCHLGSDFRTRCTAGNETSRWLTKRPGFLRRGLSAPNLRF